MKVPAIVEETKKCLEDGYCVVIGLQTTGEVRSALVFMCLINFHKTLMTVISESDLSFQRWFMMTRRY